MNTTHKDLAADLIRHRLRVNALQHAQQPRRTYPPSAPLTGRASRRAVGLRGAFVQGAPYRRVRSLRSLGLMPKAVDVAEGTYGANELTR